MRSKFHTLGDAIVKLVETVMRIVPSDDQHFETNAKELVQKIDAFIEDRCSSHDARRGIAQLVLIEVVTEKLSTLDAIRNAELMNSLQGGPVDRIVYIRQAFGVGIREAVLMQLIVTELRLCRVFDADERPPLKSLLTSFNTGC